MLACQLNFSDVYAGYLQYRENTGLFPKIIIPRIIRDSGKPKGCAQIPLPLNLILKSCQVAHHRNSVTVVSSPHIPSIKKPPF